MRWLGNPSNPTLCARDGLPPGLGILLYALQPAARKRWNRFIESLKSGSIALEPPAARHDPRFPVSLQVRLQSMDDMNEMYTRNVSMGGLFVGTALDIAEGTETKLSVIHPFVVLRGRPGGDR
jgi:hypothetical protein